MAAQRIVTVDGERLGDLIAVGNRYMFFTTHQRMLTLDGYTFDSFDELRREIAKRKNTRVRLAA